MGCVEVFVDHISFTITYAYAYAQVLILVRTSPLNSVISFISTLYFLVSDLSAEAGCSLFLKQPSILFSKIQIFQLAELF